MNSETTNIVAIIDTEGYPIGKRFYCKELEIIKVGESEAKSFFFDIGLRWSDLSHKERQKCWFVRNKIYKQPFGAPREVKVIDSNSTILYKGGHYERDVKKFKNRFCKSGMLWLPESRKTI